MGPLIMQIFYGERAITNSQKETFALAAQFVKYCWTASTQTPESIQTKTQQLAWPKAI